TPCTARGMSRTVNRTGLDCEKCGLFSASASSAAADESVPKLNLLTPTSAASSVLASKTLQRFEAEGACHEARETSDTEVTQREQADQVK
ncbi:MAG: hypothetical protein AABZ09_08730, partial [Candidatus Binatota bacterium]